MSTIIDIINTNILNRDLEFLALFGNRKGEDKPFLKWLKIQPCRACSRQPRYNMNAFVYNVPCHVRRVNRGAGIGIKPSWSAVTLCVDCHALDHSKNKRELGSDEQIDAWADESLRLYILTCLRAKLGVDWQLLLPWWMESQGVELKLAA